VSITEIQGKVPPNGHWFLEVQGIPIDAPYSDFLTTCSDLRISLSKLAIFACISMEQDFTAVLTPNFQLAKNQVIFGLMEKRTLPCLINLFEG